MVVTIISYKQKLHILYFIVITLHQTFKFITISEYYTSLWYGNDILISLIIFVTLHSSKEA